MSRVSKAEQSLEERIAVQRQSFNEQAAARDAQRESQRESRRNSQRGSERRRSTAAGRTHLPHIAPALLSAAAGKRGSFSRRSSATHINDIATLRQRSVRESMRRNSSQPDLLLKRGSVRASRKRLGSVVETRPVDVAETLHEQFGAAQAAAAASAADAGANADAAADADGGRATIAIPQPRRKSSLARAKEDIARISLHAQAHAAGGGSAAAASRRPTLREGQVRRIAIPRLHELCRGKPELLEEMLSLVDQGRDPMMLTAHLQREINADQKDAEVRAMLQQKAARAEEQRLRQVQARQRLALAALWAARSPAAVLACLARGRHAVACVSLVQSTWRRYYFRGLVRKQVQFMAVAKRIVWMLKLGVKAKRRQNSGNMARWYLRTYLSDALLFRKTIQSFRVSVSAAQTCARSWLACQAARRRTLMRLWRRVGTAKIRAILHQRKANRQTSIEKYKEKRASPERGKRGLPGGGGGGEDEDGGGGTGADAGVGGADGDGGGGEATRGGGGAHPCARSTMVELEDFEERQNRAIEGRERKDALRALRRKRNSVVLLGDQQSETITQALAKYRRAHVQQHSVEFNGRMRMFESAQVGPGGGVRPGAVFTAEDVRASGGVLGLLSGNDGQDSSGLVRPKWPPLLMYAALLRDPAFVETVERSVEEQLDLYETDRVQAHTDLVDARSAAPSTQAPPERDAQASD
eukprot:g4167.t1